MTPKEVADLLLDLRNYVSTDAECWGHDAAKQALGDVIDKIDRVLEEVCKTSGH